MSAKQNLFNTNYKKSLQRGILKKCACGKDAYKYKFCDWVCRECAEIEKDGYNSYLGMPRNAHYMKWKSI